MALTGTRVREGETLHRGPPEGPTTWSQRIRRLPTYGTPYGPGSDRRSGGEPNGNIACVDAGPARGLPRKLESKAAAQVVEAQENADWFKEATGATLTRSDAGTVKAAVLSPSTGREVVAVTFPIDRTTDRRYLETMAANVQPRVLGAFAGGLPPREAPERAAPLNRETPRVSHLSFFFGTVRVLASCSSTAHSTGEKGPAGTRRAVGDIPGDDDSLAVENRLNIVRFHRE